MKTIEYKSFYEAFLAAQDFKAKGIECKGIGLTILEVGIEDGK